jgi:hypothetical protein
MGSKAKGIIIIMGGTLRPAVEVQGDSGAAGGQVGISVAPAPSNNRLQATAGGLGGVGPARWAFAHRA